MIPVFASIKRNLSGRIYQCLEKGARE